MGYHITLESADNMPQLAKGGKYVYSWSIINEDGGILLPEEARHEYQLEPGERVILMPGSKTSGGFSIAKKSRIERSKLSDILMQNSDLAEFKIEEGKIVNVSGKILCWATIYENGQLLLPPPILEAYGVKPRDRLLVIRGSSMGIGLAAKGPLVEEARKHPEIVVFRLGNNLNM